MDDGLFPADQFFYFRRVAGPAASTPERLVPAIRQDDPRPRAGCDGRIGETMDGCWRELSRPLTAVTVTSLFALMATFCRRGRLRRDVV